MRRLLESLGITAAAASLVLIAWAVWPDSHEERLTAAESVPTPMHTATDEGQAIVDHLHAQGIDDIGGELDRRLGEVEVTETELLTLYEELRPHFGERSFEAATPTLDRIARLRAVKKAELQRNAQP